MLRLGSWVGTPGLWDRDISMDASEDLGSEDPSES